MNRQFDFLIVGQGLAGSLLYWYLQKLGKSCIVVDAGSEGASMAAAGIINPMTGRNYVKSWMVDIALPHARQCYENMESHYDARFYHALPVYRALHSVKEENDWLLRTMDPSYDGYAGEVLPSEAVEGFIKNPVKYGHTCGAARVDIPVMLEAVRKELEDKKCFIASSFTAEELQPHAQGWQWQSITAGAVIFCEGFKVVYNPFFNYLPFAPAKGNILIVKNEEATMPFNLRDEFFVTPLEDGRYWIGSGYRWGEWDTEVNVEDVLKMRNFADATLAFPFEVVEQKAGVRPSTKSRRPILGQHPKHAGLFIFNGLGTKGTSLGPYFAQMMAEHLVNGREIMPDVAISRHPFPS